MPRELLELLVELSLELLLRQLLKLLLLIGSSTSIFSSSSSAFANSRSVIAPSFSAISSRAAMASRFQCSASSAIARRGTLAPTPTALVRAVLFLSGGVSSGSRPVFGERCTVSVFGERCTVWRRRQNYGYSSLAGLLQRASRVVGARESRLYEYRPAVPIGGWGAWCLARPISCTRYLLIRYHWTANLTICCNFRCTDLSMVKVHSFGKL